MRTIEDYEKLATEASKWQEVEKGLNEIVISLMKTMGYSDKIENFKGVYVRPLKKGTTARIIIRNYSGDFTIEVSPKLLECSSRALVMTLSHEILHLSFATHCKKFYIRLIYFFPDLLSLEKEKISAFSS